MMAALRKLLANGLLVSGLLTSDLLVSDILADSAAIPQPQDPKVATVQLPTGHVVTATMMVDINSDDRADLIIACRNLATGQRSLRTHLRQATGPAFVSAPSQLPYDVDRDVVAFTYCDCTDSPGRELILLTPEQVVAVVPSKDGTPTYVRLAHHQLVWPAADPDMVLPLPNAAIDFDGDGRTDLVLPSPDAWSIWLQRGDPAKPKFTRHKPFQLGPWQDLIGKAVRGRGVSATGNSFELRISNGRPNDVSGQLVQTSTRTPQSQMFDLNGDGQLDLVMHRNGIMHAGVQLADGHVNHIQQALPLPENRLKVIDPTFDLKWPDINGDGRADLLLTTSAQREDEVEARVDLFRTNASGAWPAEPDARLRLRPLARSPQVIDADGDGRPDLVCVTLRTSSISALTDSTTSAFDAQLTIFGNNGKQFATPALLAKPLLLAIDSDLAQPFLMVRPGRRGRPGDVLLHIDGFLERRFLVRNGTQLRLATADARTPVAKKSKILTADPIGNEILIWTEHEVRVVRFRR